jgi:CRISPR/Cas system CMR subunit Cmr6 (Cas7 group RAMP superfamily)
MKLLVTTTLNYPTKEDKKKERKGLNLDVINPHLVYDHNLFGKI